MVILGHRLNDDSSMDSELIARLDLGLKTWKDIKADKIVVSGGIANKKTKVSEASLMGDYLLKHGIPSEKIVLEDTSKDTVENGKNVYALFKDQNVRKVYVVSSKYHFTRCWAVKADKAFSRWFKDSEVIPVF